MRLDKYLAHAGLGSRKELKQLIRKGHVSINDVICKKDDMHIQEEDIISLDGEVIRYQSVVYIMLNKPSDVVSATSDDRYPTVLDCIDEMIPKDCFPVGRLDLDSEGLLLITNDGVLAHDVLSPKKHVDKTYYVELEHALSDEDIALLESGTIVLDQNVLQCAHVKVIDDVIIHITIREGKYHQVKRMMEAVKNKVLYLKRISMGPLCLDETLAKGEWRYLSDEELASLKHI